MTAIWDSVFLTVLGSNGANLSFQDELGIPDSKGGPCDKLGPGVCDRNLWIVGLVNSAPYIAVWLL